MERGEMFNMGGYIPNDSVRVPMSQKDSLVSFDGPDGPWWRVITADGTKAREAGE